MKIAIRCDTSIQIGSGHFSRCFQLAKAIKSRGHSVTFISKSLQSHYQDSLYRENFSLFDLPDLSVFEEPKVVKQFLKSGKFNYLIIDHYSIDLEWESKVEFREIKTVVIDDLHNRQHRCDFLVDHNIFCGVNPYLGLTNPETTFFLGPKYALINPKYKLSTTRTFSGRPKILVFFGGMDHVGATLKYLPFLVSISREFQITIVTGINNPVLNEIKQSLIGIPIKLEIQLPDLYDAMLGADIFIGSGGVVTWERCAMGLPSLVISIASNQEEIAAKLDNAKIHMYLGPVESVEKQDLAKGFHELVASKNLMKEFSQSSLSLVPESGILNLLQGLGL